MKSQAIAIQREDQNMRRMVYALVITLFAAFALLPLLALLGCSEQALLLDGPNVVLITLESLRTDHVGAYGGASRSRPEVPVTPAIDAFALLPAADPAVRAELLAEAERKGWPAMHAELQGVDPAATE